MAEEFTLKKLKEMQEYPLDWKEAISKDRIIEWYNYFNGNVRVSFSGGKDSTVLLHLIRKTYPEIAGLFCNTGLEYPELQRHVRNTDNVEIIIPKKRFDQVISEFGYPLISKEVASTIYYARKIRGSDGNKNQHHVGRPSSTGNATYSDRADMFGDRALTQEMKDGTQLDGFQEQDDMSYMRSALFGTLPSKSKKSEKSLYTKEKWLPLALLPIPVTHYCCNVMKKQPTAKYHRKTGAVMYTGTMAEESRLRMQNWLKHGCNVYGADKQTSNPLSFWTDQDILKYIIINDIEIPSVYGDIVVTNEDWSTSLATKENVDMGKLKCTGCDRTGCMFCAFGLHLEKGETRFQRMARTHPRQYEYCMRGGQWVDNPKYDAAAPVYDGMWKNWNPKKIWVPSKEGLGMKGVFDMVNDIYGRIFYRYD